MPASNDRMRPIVVRDRGRDVSSTWVAAYAIGLVYSSASDRECLVLLIDATRNEAALLDAARHRLDGARVVEPGVADEAERLLAAARLLAGGDMARHLAP